MQIFASCVILAVCTTTIGYYEVAHSYVLPNCKWHYYNDALSSDDGQSNRIRSSSIVGKFMMAFEDCDKSNLMATGGRGGALVHASVEKDDDDHQWNDDEVVEVDAQQEQYGGGRIRQEEIVSKRSRYYQKYPRKRQQKQKQKQKKEETEAYYDECIPNPRDTLNLLYAVHQIRRGILPEHVTFCHEIRDATVILPNPRFIGKRTTAPGKTFQWKAAKLL